MKVVNLNSERVKRGLPPVLFLNKTPKRDISDSQIKRLLEAIKGLHNASKSNIIAAEESKNASKRNIFSCK